MFSLTKTIWPILVTASGVLSLTLNAPTTAQSGSSTTITWTSTSTDPTFSIELAHPDLNAAIAVANNVNPANNQITVTLPIVQAGDGYTLEAVNITDINQVFSTSGDFSIAAAPSPSPSSSTPIASAPPSAPISVASVPLTPSGVSGSLPASSLSVPSPSVARAPAVTSPTDSATDSSGPQSTDTSGAGTNSASAGTPSTTSAAPPKLHALTTAVAGVLLAFLFAGAWVL